MTADHVSPGILQRETKLIIARGILVQMVICTKCFAGILFLNWLKINWLTIASGLKVTRNLVEKKFPF